jgi:hypothetical protein
MKFAVIIVLVLGSIGGYAQESAKPRQSPLGLTTAKYKNTYLKIIFGRPEKKGREIFGGLVPFGQVWRTGANEATEMTATKDFYINGTLLKAGTYSIFTIPDKIKWTVIINKEVGLWGSYNYNEKLDLMRFDVPVLDTGNEAYESFMIHLDQKNDKADLKMTWDHTQIIIPIRFSDEN